jgi:hypothetical protein
MRPSPLRAVLVVLAVAGSSRAREIGQVTLIDEKYQHGGWYNHMSFIEQPDDWTSPYDYHHGYTCVRAEVFEFKGEVQKLGLHYCYFQDRRSADKHACTSMQVVTEPGVYYRRWRNDKMWQTKVIDWSRRLLNFMQIDNAVKGKGKAEVRITVIIVADGFRLRPPLNWDPPKDWNCGVSCAGQIMEATSNETIKSAVKEDRLGTVWSEATEDSRSTDPARAAEGRRILAILGDYVENRRRVLRENKPRDPMGAVGGLVDLAQTFAGSPKARELLDEARAWEREPATKNERTASQVFRSMRNTARNLKKKMRGGSASDPEMQLKYAEEISALRSAAVGLARKYPAAPSTARMVDLCRGLGVPLPEELVAAVAAAAPPKARLASLPPPPARPTAPPTASEEAASGPVPDAAPGSGGTEPAPGPKAPSGLTEEERADLASWAEEARPRTIARIVEAFAKGAKLHVYVEFGGGPRKGRVKAADARGLSVDVSGVSFPLTWEKLPAKRFHDLAMQVVGEGPAEALLDLAAVSLEAGHAGPMEKVVKALYALTGTPREKIAFIERAASAIRD